MPELYYLPGRGGYFQEDLGKLLLDMGYHVKGFNLDRAFLSLPFQEQIDQVLHDLQQAAWNGAGRIVAKSYGAYILLHALADRPPYPGRTLLFSPVLGAAFVAHSGKFQGSIPPRAGKLKSLADRSAFPPPAGLEIHTGAQDNGCDPALALLFAGGIPNAVVHCVPGAGHDLGSVYELHVVQRFLHTAGKTPRMGAG